MVHAENEPRARARIGRATESEPSLDARSRREPYTRYFIRRWCGATLPLGVTIMFKKLSRRTFLRGTGVALALPALDAMAPSALAVTAMGPLPKRRMLCIRYPLSLHP